MIYFIIFTYFLVCALLFGSNAEKKVGNVIYGSQLVILVLLFGLRYRVGGDSLFYEDDYPRYFTISELFRVNIFEQRYQPLWYVITAIPKAISQKFFVFQLFHAILLNTGIFYIINKYCTHRFAGVLVYYVFYAFYFNTEILRESLAVLIFAFAYPLIFKKKYIVYYVLCFFAFLIHAFAAFCFVVPVLVWLFRKPLSIVTAAIIFVASTMLLPVFITLILKYVEFNPFIAAQLRHYSGLEVNINGILKNLFDAAPVILLISIIKRSDSSVPAFFVPALNIYLILILLDASFAGAARLGNYFVVFYYIALVNVFAHLVAQKQFYKYMTPAFLAVTFLLIGRLFYFGRDVSDLNFGKEAYFYNIYYPYHSIFDQVEEAKRENISKGFIKN